MIFLNMPTTHRTNTVHTNTIPLLTHTRTTQNNLTKTLITTKLKNTIEWEANHSKCVKYTNIFNAESDRVHMIKNTKNMAT